jgi:hypothetical protein
VVEKPSGVMGVSSRVGESFSDVGESFSEAEETVFGLRAIP